MMGVVHQCKKKSGIRNFIALGCALAGSYSAIYFSKHYFFIEDFAERAQMKENGLPASLTKKVYDLIASVMKDMKLREEEMELIRFIRVEGKDLSNLGYSHVKPGAYIAVPEIFMAEPGEVPNLNLIDKRIFRLTKNEEEIEKFKLLLSMTDEAKKFALAHELYKSGLFTNYFFGIMPWIANSIMFLTIVIMYGLNNSKIKNHPNFFVLHAIFTSYLFTVYFNYVAEIYRTNMSDYRAATLGKEYIQGGISYYENNIARNNYILELYQKNSLLEKIKCIDILYQLYTNPKEPFSTRVKFLKEIQRSDNVVDKKPTIWKILNVP